jgi:CRP-like cAMP-binding protein
MYILESGHCEVLVKGQIAKRELFVRDLGPGDIFGETALLYNTPRTASVKSKVACTVGALS